MSAKFKTIDPKVQQIDRISKHAKDGPLAIGILAKPVPLTAPKRKTFASDRAYLDAYRRYSVGRDAKWVRDGMVKGGNPLFFDIFHSNPWGRIIKSNKSRPPYETLLEEYQRKAFQNWSTDAVEAFMDKTFGKDVLAKVRWIRTFHIGQGAGFLFRLIDREWKPLSPELRDEIFRTAEVILTDGFSKHHPSDRGILQIVYTRLHREMRSLDPQLHYEINIEGQEAKFVPVLSEPALIRAMKQGLHITLRVASIFHLPPHLRVPSSRLL